MNYIYGLGLAVAALLVSPAFGADQDESESTPTRLLELLPAEGRDTFGMDFYLLAPVDPATGSAPLTHWLVASKDGKTTITRHRISEGAAGSSYITISAIYGKDSRLLRQFQRWSQNGGTYVNETVGQVVDGEIEYSSLMHIDQNQDGENDIPSVERFEGKQSYDFNRDAIPSTWLPLALGYHLRKGHLDFNIRMRDQGPSKRTEIYDIQDIGKETMAIRGKQYETHLLLIKRTIERDINDTFVRPGVSDNQTLYLRCLADGVIVKMQMKDKHGELQEIYSAVTDRQARDEVDEIVVENVDFELFKPWVE